MGKYTDKGTSSGVSNGVNEEIDNFFNDGNKEDTNSLNRNEMMQLTGKELAKMAQPYSTLQLNSLERLAKAKLCDIILNKTDKQANADADKPHARTARTESQTEQMLTTALLMLSAIKQNRDGEPLNAMASEVFKKQAIVYADNKISKDEMNVDKANTALFIISTGALLFDGIIGFKNAPGLFQKLKQKFFNRPGQKKNDTK